MKGRPIADHQFDNTSCDSVSAMGNNGFDHEAMNEQEVLS